MDKIEIVNYQIRTAKKEYPMIFVNGKYIAELLSEFYNEDYISGLAPAITWLWEEHEVKVAIDRFSVETIASTVMPLLICPDDVDLNCSVIIVEVEITDNNVLWKRFGFDASGSGGTESCGTTVDWFKKQINFEFDKNEYYSFRDELIKISRDET